MLIVMRLGQHDLNFLHSVSSLLRIKNHVTIAIHFTIAELKTAVKNIEKKKWDTCGWIRIDDAYAIPEWYLFYDSFFEKKKIFRSIYSIHE